MQTRNRDQNGNLGAFDNLSGKSANATGKVQANGQTIANGGLRGPDLILTPGAWNSTNLSNYWRGQLFVVQGGRLRYGEADGTRLKFVYTTTS